VDGVCPAYGVSPFRRRGGRYPGSSL